MKASAGEKIKSLRKKMHISLDRLGELTGTSKSYLWTIEKSSSCNPSADKMVKIASALGVTMEYLIDEDKTLSSDILEKYFIGEFNKLGDVDKKRIINIVNCWVNEHKESGL